MELNKDLLFYRALLRYLGILNVSYNESENLIYISRLDKVLAKCILCSLQFTMIAILIFSYTSAAKFKLSVYNKTGNIYMIANFWCCCVVLSLLAFNFYFERDQHAKLLQKILQLNRESKVSYCSMKYSRLFGIYLMLFAVCLFTQIKAFAHAEMEVLPSICYATLFPFSFLYLGIVIVFYICITTVIEEAVSRYNIQLDNLLDLAIQNESESVYQRIHDILLGRNHLITVCHTDLNKIYGTALLFITAYILFTSPSAPFFFISVVFDRKDLSLSEILHISTVAFFWLLPWWTVLMLLFTSNGIAKEVKKTSKILGKFPRTESRLKKMVDKFFMKNLRQEPILTAYGFFSLDKRTLFKIFTAVMTYLTILVQFKEMETTLK